VTTTSPTEIKEPTPYKINKNKTQGQILTSKIPHPSI
jgi:hypothetical protein